MRYDVPNTKHQTQDEFDFLRIHQSSILDIQFELDFAVEIKVLTTLLDILDLNDQLIVFHTAG